MLKASYTPRFEKDVRRLRAKGASLDLLAEVVDLVIKDTPESLPRALQGTACTS